MFVSYSVCLLFNDIKKRVELKFGAGVDYALEITNNAFNPRECERTRYYIEAS